TWDDRSEIVELYFDANRLDGALVLCVGRAPDEQVATFYWTGSRLGGVVWRGTATGRPQDWRDTQYERVRDYLAT
ncbi:hypothetical protein, partial [Glycomyces sp. MUSA5-2]|uniref:hypothetical protein n=1 Tax=Glycomyces sp. MUSA5-2 TaxID=2053002 RepID=UPI00300B01BA